MTRRPAGLLAEIREGILDDAPLVSLLQKCIILGGDSRSETLRDWARAELYGYVSAAEVPGYRTALAPTHLWVTNKAGYHGHSQRLYLQDVPQRARDWLAAEGIQWDVPLAESVGDLEAMAKRDVAVLQMSPAWSPPILVSINAAIADGVTHAAGLYWDVPRSGIEGVLVRIRTALAELVAELISLTPEGQELPDKAATDQVAQFVVSGDRNVITYSPQTAGDGAANTMTVAAPKDEPKKESWWKRWRSRGIVVGVSTFVAAVVGIFAWLNWTPW
jgi:hypothetical protein